MHRSASNSAGRCDSMRSTVPPDFRSFSTKHTPQKRGLGAKMDRVLTRKDNLLICIKFGRRVRPRRGCVQPKFRINRLKTGTLGTCARRPPTPAPDNNLVARAGIHKNFKSL